MGLASAVYDEKTAIEFAHLSSAAYCSNASVQAWDCVPCKEMGRQVTDTKVCGTPWDHTQAYVGKLDNKCVVSFEGTETYKSMVTDLNAMLVHPDLEMPECADCKVHIGYLRQWRVLKQCVQSHLQSLGCKANVTDGSTQKVHLTGHSMGAAVSAVAMTGLATDGFAVGESYNFGMPRTGNGAFASTFTKQFAGRFYRITHHKDMIIQMPPPMWNVSMSYQHIGHEVFYDGTVSEGYKSCEEGEDEKCSKQYHRWYLDDWTFKDHLTYMDMPTGNAGCQSTTTPSAVQAMLVMV